MKLSNHQQQEIFSEELYTKIQQLPLLHTLSEESLHHLLEVSTICHHDIGSQFRFEGPRSHLAMIVISGRVALIKQLPRGRHLIVDILNPGDWFGAIQSDFHGAYPVVLRAESPTQILCFSKKALWKAFSGNIVGYDKFISELQNRLEAARDRLLLIACGNIEANLAAMLLLLVKQYGVRRPSLRSKEIAISRRELAELVGTSVETAIRITKLWEKTNVIKVAGRGKLLVLDLAYLRKLCAQ